MRLGVLRGGKIEKGEKGCKYNRENDVLSGMGLWVVVAGFGKC